MNVNDIAKKIIAKTIKKKNVNNRKDSENQKKNCLEDIGYEYENNMICWECYRCQIYQSCYTIE